VLSSDAFKASSDGRALADGKEEEEVWPFYVKKSSLLYALVVSALMYVSSYSCGGISVKNTTVSRIMLTVLLLAYCLILVHRIGMKLL
jgi:hypothetical protein